VKHYQDQSAIGGANTDYNRFQEKVRKARAIVLSAGTRTIGPREFSVHVHGPQRRALKNGENPQYMNAERPLFQRVANGQRPAAAGT